MSYEVTSGRNHVAERFRALHARPGAFVIPNPWDVGSARVLAGLGFEALATTSAGFAFSLGRRDYGVTREAVLDHARALVGATELPVSADLQNGFGDAPETVAETIRLAAATGLAGGSIEDSTGRREAPLYEIAPAAERIRAAAEAVRSLATPFVLTARAEGFLHGRRDLGDVIARLQAYQEAGAEVLFAPGLVRKEDVASVVRSVDRPLNVITMPALELDLAGLAALGVKRVSVGSALARLALGAFLRGARELRERGSFAFVREALPSAEANGLFPTT